MSIYLNRLRRDVHSTTSRIRKACLIAEIGCYYARVGPASEAKLIVQDLRSEFGAGDSVEVTIWTMLLEGLVLYYEDFDPSARDRVARAHALSVGSQIPTLRALTSAWLACFDFNACAFVPMITNIRECLLFSTPTDIMAITRCALLLADISLYTGHFDFAASWYRTVRQLSATNGDQATLGAMIHNRVAFGSARLRLQHSFGEVDLALVRQIRMEAESCQSFDALIGTSRLMSLTPIWRSRLILMEGRYVEASGLFDEYIEIAVAEGHEKMHALLLAESAYCHLNAGELQVAEKRLFQASLVGLSDVDGNLDDSATYFATLALCNAIMGDQRSCSRNFDYGRGLYERHEVNVRWLWSIVHDALFNASPEVMALLKASSS